MEDHDLLSRRSWHWLRDRISGLLAVPPAYLFRPDGALLTTQQTRILNELMPPKLDKPGAAGQQEG